MVLLNQIDQIYSKFGRKFYQLIFDRALIANYFLKHPPGDSPEKVEVHYYCIMVARLLTDLF